VPDPDAGLTGPLDGGLISDGGPQGGPDPGDGGAPAADAGQTVFDSGLPAFVVGDLEVQFLGVGGFVLRHGDDAVLTAPLFSNPSMASVLAGDIAADPDRIAQFLSPSQVADVKAIVSGHGHYDHLMDVPGVWGWTDNAVIYGNVAIRSILAAKAPDPASHCMGAPLPEEPLIPRTNVVALNDPADNRVDYRNCPGQDRCFGPHASQPGQWVSVPDANVRIMALCNSHSAQFSFVEFGQGCLIDDACVLPVGAVNWRDGETLAFLIDFLNPETGETIHRIYTQDAPADAPIGHVPAEVLAEKRVDLALLCVGTYTQVLDHPGAIVGNLDPRYAIGGHWEDFFKPQDEPIEPIPFMDVEPFRQALEMALPPDESPGGLGTRAFVPDPGSSFRFSPEGHLVDAGP
jgi:L-ascorbate metabolism protein UlaG (beta-lactamase superfamily)